MIPNDLTNFGWYRLGKFDAPSPCLGRPERPNSPYTSHFTSPDTIIPDQINPQSWDRYAYVMNNPIRYTDPSGHRCVDSNVEGSCDAVDFKLTRNYIESNYAAKVRGRWKTDELLYLAESLDLLSDHAGGSENLNDVLRDGANKWGKDEVTFLRLPGLSRDTGNNHAAWCQGHSDKGCVPGAVVFSDDIFTQEYQYSRDRYRPSELGLYRNLSAGIKVSMIHEMTHVFEDARPAAARIYSWRVPGAYPDERMANTMAFYVVSGIENWPGKPANFDFVRDIQVLWQATP